MCKTELQYEGLRDRDWAMNLSPTFPPYHVVGFTPKSLRRALRATGFEVVELAQPAALADGALPAAQRRRVSRTARARHSLVDRKQDRARRRTEVLGPRGVITAASASPARRASSAPAARARFRR